MIEDHLHLLLDRRDDRELRFRASLITSATIHTLALIALAFGPLLIPTPRILPRATPVTLVELAPERPPAPEPEPAAIEESEAEEPEPEPEPEEPDEAPTPEPEEAVAPAAPPEEIAEPEPEPEPTKPAEEPRPRTQTARRSSAGQTTPPATQQARRRPTVGVLGAASGGETVEDFPFAYYLEILRRRIAEHWNPPARGPYAASVSAEFYFRIDRQGRLITLRKEAASGHELFDLSAERSIRSATFPPLPYGYDGSSLGIFLVFIDE